MTDTKRALTRKGLQTFDKVVKAGIECIAELGFHGASTNKIARHAGVTWGTLQHQFGDKATLLEAILERVFNEQLQKLSAATDTQKPLQQRIKALLDAFWDFQNTQSSLALSEIVSSIISDPKYRLQFRPQMLQYRDRYDQLWSDTFSDVDLNSEAHEAIKQFVSGSIRGLALQNQVRSSEDSIVNARKILERTTYLLMTKAIEIDSLPDATSADDDNENGNLMAV